MSITHIKVAMNLCNIVCKFIKRSTVYLVKNASSFLAFFSPWLHHELELDLCDMFTRDCYNGAIVSLTHCQ